MSDHPLQDVLKEIIEDQPSHVGALAYTAAEELSRTLGRLRFHAMADEAPMDQLVRDLEAYGRAIEKVGVYYALVVDSYNQLCREAQRACLDELALGPEIVMDNDYSDLKMDLNRSVERCAFLRRRARAATGASE
jgi:hypothetical protein